MGPLTSVPSPHVSKDLSILAAPRSSPALAKSRIAQGIQIECFPRNDPNQYRVALLRGPSGE